MSIWKENPPTYRRNLPHFTPPDAALFITFRLHNSLPKSVLDSLQAEQRQITSSAKSKTSTPEEIAILRKKHFAKFDTMLDSSKESKVLSNPLAARIVADTLHSLDREGHVTLWCFTIMSNHVHVLLSLSNPEKSLRHIMQLLKGRSAFECNKALGRSGTFWQHESYDHVVRDGEFDRIIEYILMNPVHAGLVANWDDYPWTYLHPKLGGVAL